ncbi:MAG TPA: MarR family winged helix-turn-helix transcriptional regulator [Vicinamibacterales bacterium]|nr:MarR family winged helix-turn-helix transcriptional regulator [Vicinamibacterales bacterium]
MIAGQCLALRARRLQRTVTRAYDAALRPHGLTVAQLGLLSALALAPDAQPKTLCTMLDLEKSTLSRNVRLLAAQGWIDASRTGRTQRLRLTPLGGRTLGAALPAWQRAQQRMLRLLPADDIQTLRRSWGPRPTGLSGPSS